MQSFKIIQDYFYVFFFGHLDIFFILTFLLDMNVRWQFLTIVRFTFSLIFFKCFILTRSFQSNGEIKIRFEQKISFQSSQPISNQKKFPKVSLVRLFRELSPVFFQTFRCFGLALLRMLPTVWFRGVERPTWFWILARMYSEVLTEPGTERRSLIWTCCWICSVGEAEPEVVVPTALPVLLVALPTDVKEGPSDDPSDPLPVKVPHPIRQFSDPFSFSAAVSFIRLPLALLARVPRCWCCW